MYTVLLVEDDPVMMFLYKDMKVWSECGFTVTDEAAHGAEALRKLEKQTFDLIFTDIRMPIMDGVELLRAMREKGILTPVIFASSYSDFEYAKQGIINGLFDYLVKPIDENKLEPVLKRLKKLLDENGRTKVDSVVGSLLRELGLSEAGDDLVRQVAVYCSENYRNDLSGEAIAEAHGYNKDYFGKLFRQHFGMSCRDFCLRVRIAYAAELIRTGAYKAYEVADVLHFSSYKYFYEKFKSITGVSPTDYKFGPDSKK